ncbi:MAG: hypothetical protein KKB31_00190 [Nanoarchaeota archaeon]|nr:hypothetical protein [Nanoarchaeota archaeon]
MKHIIFLTALLLIPLVFAETTFFDNPDDFFIMGDSTATSPTGEVTGGTTGGTTSGGSCLTNWSCSSWSSCMNGIQTRICTKERINCYADLKKKPTENQSCSVETENDTESEEGNLISQSSPVNFQNIITLVIGLIVIIGIAIFFVCKRHKKKRY